MLIDWKGRKKESPSKRLNKIELDISHISISWIILGDTSVVCSIHTHLLSCLFSLEWLLYAVSVDFLGVVKIRLRQLLWSGIRSVSLVFSFLGIWEDCIYLLLLNLSHEMGMNVMSLTSRQKYSELQHNMPYILPLPGWPWKYMLRWSIL